jgi:alkaline phosphatase D
MYFKLFAIAFALHMIRTCESVRIGVISCSSQRVGKPAIWDELLKKEPDHLILLGDNIYTDKKTPVGFIEATPSIIDEQYERLSQDKQWQAVVGKLGWDNIYATWDDHDFGINDGDKTYQYKTESMSSFLNFFHFPENEISRMMRRGGVYGSYTIDLSQTVGESFKIKIILTDTRFFKDIEGTPGGDFLGEEQWEWLQLELQDPSPDVVLLGSSIQVLPTQKIVEESWSTFPESRARLLRMVSDAASPNVVLLSGDVHMAEVSQVMLADRCKEGSEVH